MINLSDCAGCRDDFYNHRENFGGKRGCWMREKGSYVDSILVHINACPPYDFEAMKRARPSCYKAPQFVTVTRNQLDSKGYWKS